MLPGMLLHVIAPPVNVDQSADARSLLDRRCRFQKVQNGSVVALFDFCNAKLLIRVVRGQNPTGIKHLSAARGIESRAVKDQSRA